MRGTSYDEKDVFDLDQFIKKHPEEFERIKSETQENEEKAKKLIEKLKKEGIIIDNDVTQDMFNKGAQD